MFFVPTVHDRMESSCSSFMKDETTKCLPVVRGEAEQLCSRLGAERSAVQLYRQANRLVGAGKTMHATVQPG